MICRCGHRDTEHDDVEVVWPHWPCLLCDCEEFEEAELH